jgi:hypothetical protein
MEDLKKEFGIVVSNLSYSQLKSHCKLNEIHHVKRDDLEASCISKFDNLFLTKPQYKELNNQRGCSNLWTKKELTTLSESKGLKLSKKKTESLQQLYSLYYGFVLKTIQTKTPLGESTLSHFKYNEWIIPYDIEEEEEEEVVVEKEVVEEKQQVEKLPKIKTSPYFDRYVNKDSIEALSIEIPKFKEVPCVEAKIIKYQIPKKVKTDVWNAYIGPNIPQHKCLCCKIVVIGITSFDVGHVIAECNGGSMAISNLRPICSACNHAMGRRNMRDFVVEYDYWI